MINTDEDLPIEIEWFDSVTLVSEPGDMTRYEMTVTATPRGWTVAMPDWAVAQRVGHDPHWSYVQGKFVNMLGGCNDYTAKVLARLISQAQREIDRRNHENANL